MADTFIAALEDFFRNVRIIDFLDIALISVFLYLILNWLRHSASRRSIVSMGVLVFLYITARFTEMYLTELLIEGLFAVLLIGVVIVFQSDLRRLAERLGNIALFWGREDSSSGSPVANLLTEAVSSMADKHIGALVAIKGREPWERHITGGIPLNGKVSIPLIHSIFNPKAPGHDGAVLIEDDTVTRFGAHLPLSAHLDKIHSGGTRHAAALGLSEQCDALVLVVSEERGTISVARDGELHQLNSAAELHQYIDAFKKRLYEPPAPSLDNWWKRRNLQTALMSVALAVVFWFAFAYQTETVYRTFSVPIEYRNLQASNIVLQDSVPLEARVTVAGSEQAFRLFDPSQLVISFNLANKAGANDLDITEKNINLPSDLDLYEVTPRSLKVKARKLQEVALPVTIDTKGQLNPALSLLSMEVQPDTITFLSELPQSELPPAVKTEPVALGDISGSVSQTKKILLPQGVRLKADASNEVTVHIKVKNKEN